MSFILRKVELNNIRIHEHFVFEPMELGITAISGENGSGKSTIVDSVAWCLYGTRVNNLRNKSLIREGVDPKTSPVSVKVTLLAGGVEYVVERKLLTKDGASECNVWGKMNGTDDLTHIAGPGISHVETYIRQTLNMDEKGFLTSVLIQQKQVDQIVSASPRERGETIEKLTGIASITKAIDLINEENRALKGASQLLQTGDIKEAEKLVETQGEVVSELTEDVQKAGTLFANKRTEVETLNKQVEAEKVKLKEHQTVEQEINVLTQRNSLLEEQVKSDIEFIESHRKEHGTIALVDMAKMKTERNQAQEVVNKHKLDMSSLTTRKTTIEKTLSELKVELSLDELINKEKECNDEIVSLDEQIEEAKGRYHSHLAEMKHGQSSLDGLSCGDTNCPTCRSEIKDPEALIEELEKEVSEHDKASKDAKALSTQLTKVKNQLVKDAKDLQTQIENLKLSTELNNELIAIEKDINELKPKLEELEAELLIISQNYDKNIKVQADRSALESAKSRTITNSEAVSANNVKIKELNERLNEIGSLTESKFNALSNKYDKEYSSLTKLQLTGRSLQGQLSLANERLGDYVKNLEKARETEAKYTELSNKIKVHSSSASVLTEFKKNRIEYSIPTLEFYASDILTKFTGGKFTKLSLDERFNTTVTTADGVVRPIAQLSGGELSSAAIALRLGIALLLNANEQNALIFDEVLVSMDEDRARQIMETISSITNCQVIFIAHNTDINSVADKVVEVTRRQEE